MLTGVDYHNSQLTILEEIGGNVSKFANFQFYYLDPGLSNLTTLSLRSSNLITAAGMRHFTNLVSLKSLDLERCPLIQGGFVYLKGRLYSLPNFPHTSQEEYSAIKLSVFLQQTITPYNAVIEE